MRSARFRYAIKRVFLAVMEIIVVIILRGYRTKHFNSEYEVEVVIFSPYPKALQSFIEHKSDA
jgi:hypothetical protein